MNELHVKIEERSRSSSPSGDNQSRYDHSGFSRGLQEPVNHTESAEVLRLKGGAGSNESSDAHNYAENHKEEIRRAFIGEGTIQDREIYDIWYKKMYPDTKSGESSKIYVQGYKSEVPDKPSQSYANKQEQFKDVITKYPFKTEHFDAMKNTLAAPNFTKTHPNETKITLENVDYLASTGNPEEFTKRVFSMLKNSNNKVDQYVAKNILKLTGISLES